MGSPEIEVIIGRLGRARGLAGEVMVDLRTDSPEQRFRRGAVVWADDGRALVVRRFHRLGDRGVVSFTGVDDRTAAEALAGAQLTARVDPGESPEEAETFYDHQLVGLDVVATDGARAGVVVRVEHPGAQDLLVVDTPAGERLVPFVGDLVPEVDLATRQVVVRAIPGLLEDIA